ncbi:MAG: DUF4238 domain-containing protein [Nitrospirales bacterium]
MPLDHYVSQVHLRKFLAPAIGSRMLAISKTTLKQFSPAPNNVCRIQEGSTNEYLSDPRAVEEFLRLVEPNYNQALVALESSYIDDLAVMTVAGFIAYVYSCSPTGMRLNSAPLRASVEGTAELLDRQGKLPPIPEELGASTLKELLENQKLKVNVDPKFPQALGIAQIVRLAAQLGNFPWEILRNRESGSPFFSSDFPIGLEQSSDPRIMNKIVPLSPTLAVRILPSIDAKQQDPDLSFGGFRYFVRSPRHNEIRAINQLLVRSAEDFVFFSENYSWIPRFIERNRHFRVECATDRISVHSGGEYQVSRQRVAPYDRQSLATKTSSADAPPAS